MGRLSFQGQRFFVWEHRSQGDFMSRAILLVERKTSDLKEVYGESTLDRIADRFGQAVVPILDSHDLRGTRLETRDTVAVFSTWNMPVLSTREVSSHFPALRYLFYGAGSVKYFAEPFFANDVRVFSAAPTNSEPVVRFATAEIVLACKGFFASRVRCTTGLRKARSLAVGHPGNHGAVVGILGAGRIGGGVVKALRKVCDAEILIYDRYLSEEDCRAIGGAKAGLEEVFRECDVISTHLPDLPETHRILGRNLFELMKPHTTFVNTARGAQVVESDLARCLIRNRGQAAVLDVTCPERARLWNPLLYLGNSYITPHIAGSTGRERNLLGLAMLRACSDVFEGRASDCEVSRESLNRGA